MGRALVVTSGSGHVRPETELASIEPAVAAQRRPFRLQFDEPLPDAVLAALADVLRRHPHVTLRAYGRELDPSLRWLSGFEHLEHLDLDLWHATSFDPLAALTRLRSLGLGETSSRRPSLGFLRALPRLEALSLEAHDRDFEAVGALPHLRRLQLRVPRGTSLEALRGHQTLEVLTVDFGGIRDLSPLADIAPLRGLGLYRTRGLSTDDLDAIGDCARLEAVSLGALRDVHSLRALTRGPRSSLRLLTLEGLTGLTTLAELAYCEQLEQLGLYDSRPADRRVDVLLRCPRLNRLAVGDVYPAGQFDALRDGFRGETLQLRGTCVRGDPADLSVTWRAAVHEQLDVAQPCR